MCTLINQSLGSCGQLYKPLPNTSSPSRRVSLLWSCTSVYLHSFHGVPGSKFVVAVSPVKKRLFDLLNLLGAWWWADSASPSNKAISATPIRTGDQPSLATPVNGWRAENITVEERRERAKWAKFPPDPEPVTDSTCQVCGGKLVVEILNYYREEVTDVVTPADTKETCLSCGKVTVVIASGPPWEPPW